MKSKLFQAITLILVASFVLATTPAFAARRVGRTPSSYRSTQPQPVAQPTQAVLTPEQKQAIEDRVNAIMTQYNLDPSQWVGTLESLASNLNVDTSDGLSQELAALSAAIVSYITTHDASETIETLVSDLKATVESNRMVNDPQTQEIVRAMILALDRAVMVYDELLVQRVKVSAYTDGEKQMMFARLASVHTAHDASWDRMYNLAINYEIPAVSAVIITQEFYTMFFNQNQTAYLQIETRPVFGAVEVKILEPVMTYALVGLTMASGNFSATVNLWEDVTGYADPFQAEVMAITYLVGGRDATGAAQSRLGTAVTTANSVISSTSNNVLVYPMLHLNRAAMDMAKTSQLLLTSQAASIESLNVQ